jgi:hypothetical protein
VGATSEADAETAVCGKKPPKKKAVRARNVEKLVLLIISVILPEIASCQKRADSSHISHIWKVKPKAES